MKETYRETEKRHKIPFLLYFFSQYFQTSMLIVGTSDPYRGPNLPRSPVTITSSGNLLPVDQKIVNDKLDGFLRVGEIMPCTAYDARDNTILYHESVGSFVQFRYDGRKSGR